MQLSVNAGLISKKASKTFSRIYPKVKEAKEAFDKVDVGGPTPRKLMVTLASKEIAYYRKVRMKRNIYQVEVGFLKGDGPAPPIDKQSPEMVPNDGELLEIIANRVAEAVETCPLEDEDRAKFRQVVADWRASLCD